MNLLLFKSQQGKTLPVLEPLSATTIPQTESNSRWSRIQERIRKGYRQLEKRIDYNERLCSALRHTPELRVYHSTSLTEEDARNLLYNFLVNKNRKHSAWMVVDISLACLGGLLTPIPGPNVFFFYPAIRAFGHYAARQGIKKYRQIDSIKFKSDPLIDKVQLNMDRIEILRPLLKQLEQQYCLTDLELHLSRRKK